MLVHQGPAFAFQLTHRAIAIDRYQKCVAKRARLLEVTHVADVQNVKDAVGENELLARRAQTRAHGENSIG